MRSTPEREAVLHVVWELQEEANLTTAELARRAGMGKMYLHRRLHGEVDFTWLDLNTLAGPLGVTYREIEDRIERTLNDIKHHHD